MLNMLFASLPKQMLDSIIRLAVNDFRMGIVIIKACPEIDIVIGLS